MSRRKGEITGHMNERDFPHLVELELPPGGLPSSQLGPHWYAVMADWLTARRNYCGRRTDCTAFAEFG
jgi:hypothetical protein